MMRSLWQVVVILLFLHVIAAVGFAAWLYTSGRVDKHRLAAAYALFEPTIAAQQAEEARLAKELEEERARQAIAARLEAAKEGPLTLGDRMTALRQTDESTQLKLDRLDRAKADIQGQIERAQSVLAQRSAELETQRQAFEQFIADRTAKLADEDFQQAVAWLAAQKPAQGKAMLQSMLAAGEQERVVDYLAAMQTRMAGKILAEFKQPTEVAQATALVNALRARGLYTMTPATGGNGG